MIFFVYKFFFRSFVRGKNLGLSLHVLKAGIPTFVLSARAASFGNGSFKTANIHPTSPKLKKSRFTNEVCPLFIHKVEYFLILRQNCKI